MTNSFFVMGASGRVGNAIMTHLLERGMSVRVGARSPARDAAAPTSNVENVPFNVGDPSTFGAAFDGVERAFLLWPPGTAPSAALTRVLEHGKRAGLKQVVFLSVTGADRIPFLPHWRIEQSIIAAGFDWVFLRPAYFFQNLSTTHRDDIRLRHEVFVPAGGGRTAMVDVRDVGVVGARALIEGHSGKAYELTSGEAPTFAEIAAVLSDRLGRPIRYPRPGIFRFLREAEARGYPRGLALFMVAEYSLTRLGMAGRIGPDISTLLGRPPISLQQFVRDQASVWQSGNPISAPAA